MRSRVHQPELACLRARRRRAGGRVARPAHSREESPASAAEAYGDLFRRLVERLAPEEERSARERRAAAGGYDELMGLAPEARTAAIEECERFATFALADLLLDVSRDVCAADPEASHELARLAQAVAGRLDPGRYGRTLLADLEARSWAYLGCARAGTDPPGARLAFLRAARHLDRGSGDPLEEAEILCLCAGFADDPGLRGRGGSPLIARVH